MSMFDRLRPKSHRKYELTSSATVQGREVLYQIKALRDFGEVRKGQVGGFIGKEANLAHEGNAWVYNNASVSQDARVSGDAQIRGAAIVCGRARVEGKAQVHDFATIAGDAIVTDQALIEESAFIADNAQVFGFACVRARTHLLGDGWASGDMMMEGEGRWEDQAPPPPDAPRHRTPSDPEKVVSLDRERFSREGRGKDEPER